MPAWGNAPGTELDKKPSAESAIHTEFAHRGRVRRAFSAARLGYYKSWGVALGLSLSAAPLALNGYVELRSPEFTAALAQRPSLESSHADHLVALRTSSHRACLEF